MSNDTLPYDEGAAAYKNQIPLTFNPYDESDWKNTEWDKGWMAENALDESDQYNWANNTFTN